MSSQEHAEPYEAPGVEDLGRLEDLTGANLGGVKSEGSSIKT